MRVVSEPVPEVVGTQIFRSGLDRQRMLAELIARGRIGRGRDGRDRLGEIERRAAAEPDDDARLGLARLRPPRRRPARWSGRSERP